MNINVDNNFTISDVGTKCKCKSEFYTILTTEGGLYLPPKRGWTQNFLLQLMIGKKKMLHNDEVKVINVAQIKGLRVPQLLLFARFKLNWMNWILNQNIEINTPNMSLLVPRLPCSWVQWAVVHFPWVFSHS